MCLKCYAHTNIRGQNWLALFFHALKYLEMAFLVFCNTIYLKFNYINIFKPTIKDFYS